MVCFRFRGITLAADFTAPALLALLMLMQPQSAVLRVLGACVLHESAHFAAAALTGQHPEMLRISATGMHLNLKQPALCPLPAYACILLAGAAANLAAAFWLCRLGLHRAAAVQLSIGLFNLLPYRCTDGGTLLHLLAERAELMHSRIPFRALLHLPAFLCSLLFAVLLLRSGVRNLPLWAMLCYLTVSELTESSVHSP